MPQDNKPLIPTIMEIVKNRLGNRAGDYTIPPPVFAAMQGRFLAFDQEGRTLTTEFPVLAEQLNPYHTMQGGIVAAAIDNTLGPLSMLLAPPNVTRQLEVTYSQPIPLSMGKIIVTASLVDRKGQRLFFKATVRDEGGKLLARAKAVHWIVENDMEDKK